MEAQEKGGVSLREYIDNEIKHVLTELGHIREKIAHEKELNTNSAKGLTKALELQATKYEQRLDDLNHEAERLSLMVTAEMFQEVVTGLRKDIVEISARITKNELWISHQEGKQYRAQLISAIAALIALAAFIFSIFKK